MSTEVANENRFNDGTYAKVWTNTPLRQSCRKSNITITVIPEVVKHVNEMAIEER